MEAKFIDLLKMEKSLMTILFQIMISLKKQFILLDTETLKAWLNIIKLVKFGLMSMVLEVVTK